MTRAVVMHPYNDTNGKVSCFEKLTVRTPSAVEKVYRPATTGRFPSTAFGGQIFMRSVIALPDGFGRGELDWVFSLAAPGSDGDCFPAVAWPLNSGARSAAVFFACAAARSALAVAAGQAGRTLNRGACASSRPWPHAPHRAVQAPRKYCRPRDWLAGRQPDVLGPRQKTREPHSYKALIFSVLGKGKEHWGQNFFLTEKSLEHIFLNKLYAFII
jgi:hypothetical protein